MKKIKKVVADPYFKKTYYQINNSILDKKTAESYGYGDIIKAFDIAYQNADNKIKPNFTVKAEFRVFPSYEKMVEMIDEKIEKIFENLQLEKIKYEEHKITKAMIVFYYLVNHLSYDMTTKEFLNELYQKQVVNKDQSESNFNLLKDRYIELHDKQNNIGLSREEESEAWHIINQMKQIKDDYNYDLLIANKSIYTTLLFDAIIYNKGVCSNFSYAYNYMLEKLNIKSYMLEIGVDNIGEGHIFNIVEDSKGGKPLYYIVDLTQALDYKKFGTSTLLENFGLNKEYIRNVVAVWEFKYPLSDPEHISFEVDENKEKIENMLQYISNNHNLKKQKNIAKQFIKVKLAKEELEP